MRRLDAQLRDTRKKLAAAVRASGTTLTEVFGVGPVIAGTITGDIADVSRFPGRDHFASYNGTAPVEVSSGNRKVHRLSLRGNRRINHAIHMTAITQIRHRHSDGRAYYEKKLAEGKTHKEALRSLKRRISDAIFACLLADARRAGQRPAGRAREGDQGATLTPARPHAPNTGSWTSHSRTGHHDTARHQGSHTLTIEAGFKENRQSLDSSRKEDSFCHGQSRHCGSSAGCSDLGDLGAAHFGEVRLRSMAAGHGSGGVHAVNQRPAAGKRGRPEVACLPHLL